MPITKIKAKNDQLAKKSKNSISAKVKMVEKIKPKNNEKAKSKSLEKTDRPKGMVFRIFIKITGYFKGSWQELKQVRWPNRRAAWALTGAVILFTGFFVILIIFLDYIFQLLFKIIIR